MTNSNVLLGPPSTIGVLGFNVGVRECIEEQFVSTPVSTHQRATLSLWLQGPSAAS